MISLDDMPDIGQFHATWVYNRQVWGESFKRVGNDWFVYQSHGEDGWLNIPHPSSCLPELGEHRSEESNPDLFVSDIKFLVFSEEGEGDVTDDEEDLGDNFEAYEEDSSYV